MKRPGLFFVSLVCLITAVQADDGVLKTSPLAVKFGSQPDIRSMHISPDGSKLVFIQYHPDGIDIVSTWDMKTRKGGVIFSGKKGDYEVTWCRWANKERVLCGTRGTDTMRGNIVPVNHLVGVNADGKKMELLIPKDFKDSPGSTLGNPIDILVDDSKHILVQYSDFGSTGVGSLNIYNSMLGTKVRGMRNVFAWLSDGRGEPRLNMHVDPQYRRWDIRDPGKIEMRVLHETKADDYTDRFVPVGFGDDPDELMVLDDHNGRQALFRMDLAANGDKQLVFAHDRVDVISMQSIGKYNRGVAAVYMDGKLQRYYFDKDLQQIHSNIAAAFPDQSINIEDEDWDRRHYIVFIHSDSRPGVYYSYDREDRKLAPIGSISSKLKDQELIPATKITYRAKDNTDIPAYLTLPAGGKKSGLPVVILPQGGQNTVNTWGFDVLIQFLVANGYAVMQSNYRGSTGLGREWLGLGPLAEWRKAASDINDGVQYLIKDGIADPNRICAVGWDYGAYLALLSVIENHSLYKCVVSIAGISDPDGLRSAAARFGGGNSAQGIFSNNANGANEGSPLNRVGEIKIPVLLAHGKEDFNVPFSQSEDLSIALKKQLKIVEFIQYDHAGHDIRPPRYRIDLFTRVAEFLKKYTAK